MKIMAQAEEKAKVVEIAEVTEEAEETTVEEETVEEEATVVEETTEITGIVLTKLDGTAKGGVVLGIVSENKIPVKFIGVGEQIDDMRPFDSKEFAGALFEEN